MNDGEKPSLIGDVLFKGQKPGGIRGRRKKRSNRGSWEEKSETTGEVGEKKARPLGELGRKSEATGGKRCIENM